MPIQFMCKNKVLAYIALFLAEKQHLTGCKALFSRQGHSLRSGSADSCICFSYAYAPWDNNYTWEEIQTKKKIFLNKMPKALDAVRTASSETMGWPPGNAEFLLRSHVCKIGKSPRKHSC